MKNLSFVFVFVLVLSGALSAQLWDPDTIYFNQLHILTGVDSIPYSPIGMVTFGYTPDILGYYVNIVSPDTGYHQQWIVRNVYLPDASWIATQQFLSVQLDLTMLGATPGYPFEAIGYAVYLTDSMLLDPPLAPVYDWGVVDTFTDDAEGIEPTDTMPGLFDDIPYPEFVAGDDMTEVEYRGCRVPNIDLDDRNHPDTDTYAGDKNACGPASAANSLKWLADVSPGITITDDHRTVMEELSALMNRPRNGGVTPENFIRGKLDYINAHGLNINVKFQSYHIPRDSGDVESSCGGTSARNDGEPGNRYPTWDWLKSEVKDSEDVEILYYWKDSDGHLRGHAAVVTGIEETATGRGTVKIKHDRRQGKEDSTKTIQEPLEIYTDGYGRMRIRGKRAVIGGVVSESPGTPFVNIGERSALPKILDLKIRPNPFNSSVGIRVLGLGYRVSDIQIFDINGRIVAEIPVNGSESAKLSSTDAPGVCRWRPDESLGSGVFLVRAKVGDESVTKRVVYMK